MEGNLKKFNKKRWSKLGKILNKWESKSDFRRNDRLLGQRVLLPRQLQGPLDVHRQHRPCRGAFAKTASQRDGGVLPTRQVYHRGKKCPELRSHGRVHWKVRPFIHSLFSILFLLILIRSRFLHSKVHFSAGSFDKCEFGYRYLDFDVYWTVMPTARNFPIMGSRKKFLKFSGRRKAVRFICGKSIDTCFFRTMIINEWTSRSKNHICHGEGAKAWKSTKCENVQAWTLRDVNYISS